MPSDNWFSDIFFHISQLILMKRKWLTQIIEIQVVTVFVFRKSSKILKLFNKIFISISLPFCHFFKARGKILTSVGPAYIIGDGKMAITVESGSRTLSFKTARCCSILTGRGTSSSFVQPPILNSKRLNNKVSITREKL